MHGRNTDKKVALWLVLLCSVVLARQSARADVVTDWNLTAIRAAQAAGQPNPMFARNLAMVHAAIYDAINAIDRQHTAYAVDLKAKPGASIDAAAAAAAYGVLTKLYWSQTPAFDYFTRDMAHTMLAGPETAADEHQQYLQAARKNIAVQHAGSQMCLIAQEVEAVVPEVVTTDEAGYKAIKYPHLTALLIEAVKEQQALIEAQHADITRLQASTTALQAQVQDLQARVVAARATQVALEDIQAQLAQLSAAVQRVTATRKAGTTDVGQVIMQRQ